MTAKDQGNFLRDRALTDVLHPFVVDIIDTRDPRIETRDIGSKEVSSFRCGWRFIIQEVANTKAIWRFLLRLAIANACQLDSSYMHSAAPKISLDS